MSTIEERLQVIEQEHSQLKKTIELQTIAIGALVNKATLEKLNEKYDKIFDTLIAHDRLTNERLGDIQNQIIEQDNKLDGKIVGLQTEMRQRFNEQDNKIAALDNKVTELQTTQTEHTTILEQHTTLLTEILARLPKP